MDFPSLSRKPSLRVEEHVQYKTLRSPSEAGYVVTRPLWTRSKRTFHVEYGLLSQSDYDTLKDFFESSTRGGSISFNWTNPIDGNVYVVRFVSDTLSSTMVSIGKWQVSFELEEV